MVLELTKEQRGNLFRLQMRVICGNQKPKQITKEQVIEVKALLDTGLSMAAIHRDTGLSLFHIRWVKRGYYDLLK